MKKNLIASACAFTLCFTSCASKQAPETEAQTQAPVVEQQENEEDSQTDHFNNSAEDNSEESEKADISDEDMLVTSEDFPEPELLIEPEIITLEPVENSVPSEAETTAEKVETEEPPVITDVEVSLPSETEVSTENTELSENINESEDQNLSTEKDKDEEITGVSDTDDDGITAIGGGIDITDDDSNSDEDTNPQNEIITPSRSVSLKKFEYLDVIYPGSGWIYMGLTDNSKDIAYFGRKLGTKDTQFSLQARNAGTKIVHFYRNDPLTRKYLDDYIEVIILPENGSSKTHIQVPEYKLPVQKKNEPVTNIVEELSAESSDNKAVEAVETKTVTKPVNKEVQKTESKPAVEEKKVETAPEVTATKTEEPVQTVINSDTLLKEAQVLYNEKEYSAALKKLNQFFEFSTDNRDEALYLKGQILEAKSDVRDIKGAIEAYTSLTKNYPASKRWDDANKRIIYLKRFYLEVR